MKILILTIGSRGDIQPYAALGRGLLDAGHTVTLCAPERFEPFVAEHGLAYRYMNNELVELLESELGREIVDTMTNPYQAIKTMIRLAKRVGGIQRRMLDDAWAAATNVRPDLILYHLKMHGAHHFAERLGVPAIMTPLFPMYAPTGRFPCIGFPALPLGRSYNRATYTLVGAISSLALAPSMNRWRREHGLPDRPLRRGVIRTTAGVRIPILHGHSRHVCPVPDDWPATTVATGYWHLPESGSWSPPDDLASFLDAGDPPVYVGFGSMAGRDPARLARIVIEATELAGVRCLLSIGWGGMDPPELPNTVFKITEAPHDWLFPRVAAVVHHGGAGTTAAGLRAGRPTIVCPFFMDQPYWGRRVRELGVGVGPIPKKRLTPERLAEAITRVTTDTTIRANAEELGMALSREDGVGEAVRLIETLVGNA